MSKFNNNPSIARELNKRSDAVQNYEGGLAFGLDPYMDLYIRAASTLVGEHKFYTDANTSDKDLLKSINAMAKIDPEFILQLAVYCREELYLRSVSLMLVAEFANNSDCVGKVHKARKYVTRVIQRADELTELIAYQLNRNLIIPRDKTKLPMLIRFGVRDAFNKFDKYRISKYNRTDAEVKMRDAMFLTHPKPKNELEKEIFDSLADGTMESPETWEVTRSTGTKSWHDVINDVFYKNGRVNNYMAILRNLRNCLKDSSVTADDISLLCSMISNRDAVLYSKQLPFRFYNAYSQLYDMNDEDLTSVSVLHLTDVMDALEEAVIYSIDNFPKLSGSSTLIACDVSSSMEMPISYRPSRHVDRRSAGIQRFDIGILLGMMANRFCGHTITGMFGDIWKVVPMSKTSGVLKNAMDMHSREGEVGYSTNGYLIIDYLLENDIKVDRIMIFTDSQMWDSRTSHNTKFEQMFPRNYSGVSVAQKFILYQRKYPDTKLYCFDLAGYGTVIIPQDIKNVCFIGGWSDKVFDFVVAFESGSENVVIEEIKSIRP